MPVKMHNFMGRLGWNLQKMFPKLSSESYLKLQFISRGRAQKDFIKYFMEKGEIPYPNVVNLETINRCNNICAFCTANKHAEKRPYMRMEDELFYNIIDQLRDWGYKGHLTLYGNNEPWLDTRIVEFHKYCREQLPDSYIFMSTNGLLLDIDKVKQITPYVDQLIINNYCEDMKLFPNIKEIYEYTRNHPKEFEKVEILIQMRYSKAVLTNRAGSAPNKVNTQKVIKETCLMPFTDMFIFPNGKLGICCCDNFEVTNLADLSVTPVAEAWNSIKYREVREAISGGRQNYGFCKHCDFIDAGLRMDLVNSVLKNDNTKHGARQTLFGKSK